jgi:hypothetical protein
MRIVKIIKHSNRLFRFQKLHSEISRSSNIGKEKCLLISHYALDLYFIRIVMKQIKPHSLEL